MQARRPAKPVEASASHSLSRSLLPSQTALLSDGQWALLQQLAIGKPGQRVFYLQAYQDQRTITVIIEKAQLQSMAIGIEQFLSQVSEQNPDLSEASGDYIEDVMRINSPVDPLFRVGEIGLGYDKDRDRVVVFTKELLTEEEDPESAAVVRFDLPAGLPAGEGTTGSPF